MTTTNKTGRKYGEKYGKVLKLAKRKKRLTALDLVPLGMTRQHAKQALHNMKLAGRFRVVKPGGMGRYAEPAVYELTEVA